MRASLQEIRTKLGNHFAASITHRELCAGTLVVVCRAKKRNCAMKLTCLEDLPFPGVVTLSQPPLQGYLAHKKPPPTRTPLDPRHGPTEGSYGVAFSYERGTPVHFRALKILVCSPRCLHLEGGTSKRVD